MPRLAGPDKYTAMFSTDDASIFGEELVSDPNNFAFFSRFMVHQNFRRVRTDGSGLADALYAACFAAVRERGAKILLLNCTPALSPYYERFGFVRYKQAYCDIGGMGLQIPLAMPLEAVSLYSIHLLFAWPESLSWKMRALCFLDNAHCLPCVMVYIYIYHGMMINVN
jgi:hypothetical protein